jgi:hypothetical protein
MSVKEYRADKNRNECKKSRFFDKITSPGDTRWNKAIIGGMG